MDLKQSFWWTILCGLLLLTTVVPFALAPIGGQIVQDKIFTGTDVANQIMNGFIVGLYNGSTTSFYVILTIIWLVGFAKINPNIITETKQFIHWMSS